MAWLLLLMLEAGPGVVERLGDRVPRELELTDAHGAKHRLGDLFDGRTPVVVTPLYYGCPALCGLVRDGTASALRDTGLEAGRDYRVIAYSIDPHETAPPDEVRGWTFLSGESASFSSALGFSYQYDEASKTYVHPAAIMVLTPDGRIARYFYGVEYAPKDLRLALVEASAGRVGTTLDRLELLCRRYDAEKKVYALSTHAFLRGGGLVIFAAVATLLGVLWRRERTRAS